MIDNSTHQKDNPYIIMDRYDRKPDILFITIPPVYDLENFTIPEDLSNKVADHPNTGLAFLATQISDRTEYKAAICYGHQIKLQNDKSNEKSYININQLSKICLESEAKIIGLSLMSPLELKYSRKLIDKIKLLASSNFNYPPVFIVGGTQATLDKNRTSKILNIKNEYIIPGRGLVSLLRHMDNILKKKSNFKKINYSDPVSPDFLKIYNDETNRSNSQIIPNLNVLSSGGRGCINNNTCSFCTAYFLGSKKHVKESDFFSQINKLATHGMKSVLASDNSINLSNEKDRISFLKRIKYAHSKGVPVIHFLSRPDSISMTPIHYLERLNLYSVQSILLGIESGNLCTISAMKKYPIKNNESDYLFHCENAAKKLIMACIKPIFSFILGYPVQNIDGRNADFETITFLRKLMILTDFKATFEIHLIHLAPGSGLYSDLLKRGASQENLDKFNYDCEIQFRNFIIRNAGSNIKFQSLLLEENEIFIDSFLTFLEGIRSHLNSLLKPGNHY